MKRALLTCVFALAVVRLASCVPWDALVDECLESGRCEFAADGAIYEVDAGEDDAGGAVPDSGTPDAGAVDAGGCPAPVDDATNLGGCRRGGICGAVFIDGGPVRLFAVEKQNPCGSTDFPSVSVFGDRALLAWSDVDAGGAVGQRRVRWAEVDLDAPSVTANDAFTSAAPASFSAVAYRGDGGALAFAAQTGAGRFHDAYVCRLSNGALSSPVPAFETDVDQTELSLAASDGGYLLLFREAQKDAGTTSPEGVRAVRLSLTAQPLSSSPGSAVAMTTRLQETPQVIFDGLDYRAVWADSRNGNNSTLFDVFTASIAPGSLAVSGTSGTAIISTPAQTDEAPSLACATPSLCATAYLTGTGQVKVSMINDGGAGSQVQLSSGAAMANTSTGIGFTGREFLIVWAENTTANGTNIHYARVGLDGGVTRSEQTLLDVPGNQLRPAVSCSLQACAVVWQH